MSARDHFHISQITSIVKGTLESKRSDDLMIRHLLIDSRKLIQAEACLFIALKSAKNDGHNYILPLYERGVRNFLVEQIPAEMNDKADVNFIVVKDTLAAMQAIAAAHRMQFEIPVVGITGSNGKTIVKEWLAALLQVDKNVVFSPKSYNSQVGVPLSVWEMNADNEIAVFEAGISEPGEMDKLQVILKPTIGIFTNIGSAHDEYFLNRTQKIAEKLKLFTKVNLLIYCLDMSELSERIAGIESFRDVRLFAWSEKNQDADLYIEHTEIQRNSTVLNARFQEQEICLRIPFSDRASIENCTHCWAFMLSQGYANDEIQKRIILLNPVEMRMELKDGVNNCSLINDSYSSDYNSLMIAINFLTQQQQHQKKTIILSDILQSGQNEVDLYQSIANVLDSKGIHHLIGIGPSISRQAKLFPVDSKFYPNTEAFLDDMHLADFQNETILLKGARVFQFEKINKILQQKAHATVLDVNMNAFEHNLNYYRSKLHPNTKIMAMVKAFSYGSGSFEIANFLEFHNVDYVAVAYADEGVELRRSGIKLPIMVMNPEEQGMEEVLRNKLEPEIFSLRMLHLLQSELEQIGNEHTVNIHLKLDTGMHRLGFEEQDIDELIEQLKQYPTIYIRSIFSHLAASDNADFDDFTKEQISRFERMSSRIKQAFPEQNILCHIANSSAISRFPEAQMDMVRLGIGLYGISSNSQEQQHLQNVSTLKTVLSQIKRVKTLETVGYNRQYKAMSDRIIGLIPIGYADGLSRRAGNERANVWINGYLAPIIGNVCMDMCMIDITDIPAKENDEVIIFGNEHPIQHLANAMETIPYEVLTSVSRRVKRVYHQE